MNVIKRQSYLKREKGAYLVIPVKARWNTSGNLPGNLCVVALIIVIFFW